MKKIGIAISLIVLVASIYPVFFTQIEQSRIILYIFISTITSLIFMLGESISKVTIPFLEIQTNLQKAKLDVKEIGGLLKDIQAHKDMIELIIRESNTAQKQMKEIENIANDAHLKAAEFGIALESINSKDQKIEKILKDAQAKVERLEKKISDLDNNLGNRILRSLT